MSRPWAKWVGGLAFAVPFATQAGVDLTVLDRDMVGPRAQVLVLGTMHLAEMSKEFDPKALDPVLDKLAAFKPDIITIESLPGEECDMAARNPAVYGADYCASTEAAKAATGLEIPGALAEINKTLKAWPIQPTAAQRRRLASLFLAASDRSSAYVQWLQLPAAERRAGDGLDAVLVEALKHLETRNNEDYQIAAKLAARLGLQRVHQVDNHTGDNANVPDVKAFGASVQAAWNSDRAELDAAEKVEAELSKQKNLLPLYQRINRPQHLQMLAESNVSTALRFPSPQHYPQVWVAGWETRNLRMVANIRAAFRERPDARVLSIVGASHKPWFDSWLGQLSGVEIVDAERVLK